ncbi:porin [Ferrimonas pelagia]|uniref:Porin n=1 Tax=Ferrimonas pelagia TaxID=1177826 RepID=A0ABP9ETH1_9GAMM
MAYTRNALLALGIMCSVSSLAASPLSLYGKINLTAQHTDKGEGSYQELRSNASRFGVKGSGELNDSIEVFYQLEWAVDVAKESGSDNFKSRGQYVGFRGDFGTTMFGREDTINKEFTKRIDLFNDYEADFGSLWKGEVRSSNALFYYTPTWNNLGAAVTYILSDSPEQNNGISSGVFYGDAKLNKSPFYAAILVDREMQNKGVAYDVERVALQTRQGPFLLGAIYHQEKPSEGGVRQKGFMVNGQYSWQRWDLKLQHQSLEDDQSTSLGIDRHLSKTTKLFTFYTYRELETKANADKFLALGVEHRF